MKLTETQLEHKESFKKFVDNEVVPFVEVFEKDEGISKGFINKIAEQGYLGALIPKSHGGLGFDKITYGLLCEELGRGFTSILNFVMLQNMLVLTIFNWGNDDQKEKWLSKIIKGEAVFSFALTEPNIGSDAKNIETFAVEDEEFVKLSGSKKWISFGKIADAYLVFAQYSNKPTAFIVEKNSNGLVIEPVPGLLGLNSNMTAHLLFEDCLVKKDNMLGDVGMGFFPIVLSSLNLGRYSLAWGCFGIAKACKNASLEYSLNRKQFGVAISEHQLIQQMISDMIVNVNAMEMLCLKSAYSYNSKELSYIEDIFVAKYFASTKATQIANDALQIHGAIGCDKSHPIQRYLRDARMMEIIEGTNQIHQIEIAKFGYRNFRRST